MAEVAVAPTDLEAGTRSGDLVGSGTDMNNNDTFTIDAENRTDDLLIIMEEQDAAAATITFDAGDEPPSMRAGLGSDSVALAASDMRAVILEGGRHIQDDGTVTGSVSGGVRMTVLRMHPKR